MVDRVSKAGGKGGEASFETVLNVRRVAKVIKGGRRFAFSALVVVGNGAGRVGYAMAKSRDVSTAISRALKRARKRMVSFPLYKGTLPYTVEATHGASRVLLRSASKGTGVIAGGAVRAVMEALGVQDVLTKSLGSSTAGNVVKATFKALEKLCTARHLARVRGMTVAQLVGGRDVSSK